MFFFAMTQGITDALSGGGATTVVDPVQWILQGGGFALAVYMVMWLTRTMSATLDRVTAAIERNTAALEQLQGLVRQGRND
jgi:hypothetical protein